MSDDTDPQYAEFLRTYEQLASNEAFDLERDEDEGEEEEEEDEEEEGREDEDYVPEVESPRVLQNGPSIDEALGDRFEEEGHKRRRTAGGEACSSSSQENEWNRSEIDGLFCPICMDAWTNDGGHHIWCHILLFSAFILGCI